MIKGTNITTMTGTDGCYAINAGPEGENTHLLTSRNETAGGTDHWPHRH